MNFWLPLRNARRGLRVWDVPQPAEPPGPGGIAGVGSASTSLVDHPKVTNATTGDWYVDAGVASSGDGTSLGTAFKTLAEGLAALTSGDTLLVKSGTYSAGNGITRSTAWAALTRVMAYGTDRPILDGSNVPFDGNTLRFSGAVNELWHGFHVRNQNAGGTNGGQTVVFSDNAHDCTLSSVWVSHSLKDGIWGFNAYDLTFLDCAVWRLGDGFDTDTNTPDTYAITGSVNAGLQGITYVRCFSAHAADDGFDFFRNNGGEAIDCVVYKPGYYWNGNPAGDGNGFKMGSAESNSGSNKAIGCIVIGARNNGVDDNSEDDDVTMLRCTAVDCGGWGFQMGASPNATIHDNIGLGNSGASGDPNARDWGGTPDSFNTWNLGITNASFADAGGGDYSLAEGSACIGAGISGGNLGASEIALAIAMEWLAKDLSGGFPA